METLIIVVFIAGIILLNILFGKGRRGSGGGDGDGGGCGSGCGGGCGGGDGG